jgi:hypothetical protein
LSCDQGVRAGALASARNGIAALAGKKAFYLGLALAGTLLGGGLWLTRRRPAPAPTSPPVVPPPLPGQERIEPLPPDRRRGQSCADCHAQSKPGLWYEVRGRAYCQDCAPGAAKTAGVTLTTPAPVFSKTAIPHLPPGKRVNLKPKLVPVGPLNLEGYAVLAEGQETGLSLVPEFKVVEGGELKVNRARWFVHYDRAGRAIAGPFESVNQAKGMAALMAHLDWTQAVENFSDEDIQRAVQWGNRYRENIEHEQMLRQLTS